MSLFSAKETVTLSVKGMHCPKCVARVNDALENIDEVTAVEVSLEKENAVVEGRGLEPNTLIAAIEELGFTASVA